MRGKTLDSQPCLTPTATTWNIFCVLPAMKHAALPLLHLKIRVVDSDWRSARYHLTGQKGTISCLGPVKTSLARKLLLAGQYGPNIGSWRYVGQSYACMNWKPLRSQAMNNLQQPARLERAHKKLFLRRCYIWITQKATSSAWKIGNGRRGRTPREADRLAAAMRVMTGMTLARPLGSEKEGFLCVGNGQQFLILFIRDLDWVRGGCYRMPWMALAGVA